MGAKPAVHLGGPLFWQDRHVQSVEPEAIKWSNFVYPIHHAEHAKLDRKQRQAVQHYAEMAQRLVKKRDQYRSRVASIPRSGLGVSLRPDAEMQEDLFELTHAFFEHLYSTLGALASVHGRIKVFGVDPPISSVEKFLAWWSTRSSFWKQEESVSLLLQARNFRTLLAHPQQQVVFNWGTRTLMDLWTVVVVLDGEASSAGRIPTGAVPDALDQSKWEFQAPNMSDVLDALLTLTSMTFHVMPATFPLPLDEETCTWEADGFGSAPAIALEKLIEKAASQDPSAFHVDFPPVRIPGTGPNS